MLVAGCCYSGKIGDHLLGVFRFACTGFATKTMHWGWEEGEYFSHKGKMGLKGRFLAIPESKTLDDTLLDRGCSLFLVHFSPPCRLQYLRNKHRLILSVCGGKRKEEEDFTLVPHVPQSDNGGRIKRQ